MDTLYNLSTELSAINDEIITAEGELSPDLEKKLDDLQIDFKQKASNIGRWMLNLTGNEEMLDVEIIRLQKRKRISENLYNRLKEYLKFCMEKADVTKLDFTAFTVRIQKNPPSVQIEDETKLPSRFVRIKQIVEIDKSKILDALKSGECVGGAILISDKTHLRIK